MSIKLLLVVNVDWFFISHRLPIAIAAKEMGYDVHIATTLTQTETALSKYGFIIHPLNIRRSSIGFIGALQDFFRLSKLFLKLRPDIVHLVTIKPVLIGGICARITRVPAVVSAVSGLGYIFTGDNGKMHSIVRKVVISLYRSALSHPNQTIIFQNPDDQKELLHKTRIPESKTTIIRGSGIDLSNINPVPEASGAIIVSMAARLLHDKGVFEFIEAARILQQKDLDIQFWLIGGQDEGNPANIGANQLDSWRAEGIVELLGFRNDVLDLYSKSHIVVLPSYREGLPRSLIEAAASGKPIITTDVPGCRDAIDPGKSGILVPPRDAYALAKAIEELVLDSGLRHKMGTAGRRLSERIFDINKVTEAHLSIYQELVGRR